MLYKHAERESTLHLTLHWTLDVADHSGTTDVTTGAGAVKVIYHNTVHSVGLS